MNWLKWENPPAHATCSYIDSSGHASGPIRRCLFIDYEIKYFIVVDTDRCWERKMFYSSSSNEEIPGNTSTATLQTRRVYCSKIHVQ